MATLYIHPADSSPTSKPDAEGYDDQENHRNYDSYPTPHHHHHHHNLNRYASPFVQSQQHHHRPYTPSTHPMHYESSPTSSLKSVQSVRSSASSTVPPPPTLFFPFDDDDNKKNAKLSNDTPKPAHPTHDATATNHRLGALPAGLPNLSNLALPPLSALTASDSKLLLNIEGLSSLNKLSIAEIQNELNNQRLKNETLLAKLHMDQKKFLKVCKHYEKKNAKLQENAATVAKKNKTSVQSANVMVSLLKEHKSEMGMNQQENVQSQVCKAALWKGIATNMQLLSEVNSLNKQIDAYHLLIAKKNQEYTNNKNTRDSESSEKKTNKEEDSNDDIKEPESSSPGAENSTTTAGFDTMSIHSTNTAYNGNTNTDSDDPAANYAQQLIARNKRYHEILALLRQKVDELRACRKKL
eukprot:179727_1